MPVAYTLYLPVAPGIRPQYHKKPKTKIVLGMAQGGAQASSKDSFGPKTRPSCFPLLVPRLAVRGRPRARGSLSFRARAARRCARFPAAPG